MEEHPAWIKNRNKYAELLVAMTDLHVLQDPFAKVPLPGPLQTLNHYGGVSAVSEKKIYDLDYYNETSSPSKKLSERGGSTEELQATIDAQNQIISEQNYIIESLRRELARLRQGSRTKSPLRRS